MSEQMRPASLETAFGNARALCHDVDAEKLCATFDVAMDMACRLNELFSGAPAAVAAPRPDAPVLAQRTAGRHAQ